MKFNKYHMPYFHTIMSFAKESSKGKERRQQRPLDAIRWEVTVARQ